MSAPDVVALPLDAALEEVRNSGAEVEILKTYPTRSSQGNGRWRVVRQTSLHGSIVLVAAEETLGVAP